MWQQATTASHPVQNARLLSYYVQCRHSNKAQPSLEQRIGRNGHFRLCSCKPRWPKHLSPHHAILSLSCRIMSTFKESSSITSEGSSRPASPGYLRQGQTLVVLEPGVTSLFNLEVL